MNCCASLLKKHDLGKRNPGDLPLAEGKTGLLIMKRLLNLGAWLGCV